MWIGKMNLTDPHVNISPPQKETHMQQEATRKRRHYPLASPTGIRSKYGKTNTEWNIVYDPTNDKVLVWTTTVYGSIDDEDAVCSPIKKARVKTHSPGMLSQFQANSKEATSS
jgi:hypothetical protein